MATVFLGLGSNIDRDKNIAFALQKIGGLFGEVVCSPIYESESVGFQGSNFFNLVVRIESDLSIDDLAKTLKDIEDKAGRDRTKPKFSPRELDIDILLVDNLVGEFNGIALPRDEILKNAFVLLPLCELAPKLLHPVLKESYSLLWEKFDKESQNLWRVEM